MVTGEEALDRAEAEAEALRRKIAAHFLDGGVAIGAERGQHGGVVNFDALRPAVAAERLGTWVALLALPRAPAAELAALTPNRSAASRCVAPACTADRTRVRRSRDSAFDMPAGLPIRQTV